jgi:hypothetical protein
MVPTIPGSKNFLLLKKMIPVPVKRKKTGSSPQFWKKKNLYPSYYYYFFMGAFRPIAKN